jgi:HK97 family phage portal protein
LAAAQQQQGVGLGAAQANRQNLQNAAQLFGSIGTNAQQAGLAGAQAQLAAGQQQQQTQQAGLQALYNQFQQEKGFPYQQAQFLATRKFTSAEIAGQMFMIDPTELGIGIEGSSLTYANLEQRNTRFVRVTLLPWIVRLEKALSDLLAQPRYVKFNLGALLRGDLQTRYAAYAVGIGAGFLEPNEARDWEDLPPMDDTPDTPDTSEGASMQENAALMMAEMRAARVARQTVLRAEAARLGDSAAIVAADAEIATTEGTIATLEAL